MLNNIKSDFFFGITDVKDLIMKYRNNPSIYISVKNLEDDIKKMFNISTGSSFVGVNYPLLFATNNVVGPLLLDDVFGELPFDFKKYNGFVICGKIMENVSEYVLIPRDNDLFFYNKESLDKFEEFINNYRKLPTRNINIKIEEQNDKEIRFNIKNRYSLKFQKKLYSSPAEILLTIPRYVHRVGYDFGESKFYGTAMFYLEHYRLSSCDKIINFEKHNANYKFLPTLHKYVNMVALNELKLYLKNNNDFEILDKDGITGIESALCMFVNCNDIMLCQKIVEMIIMLSNFTYRRSPKNFFIFLFFIYKKDWQEDHKKLADSIFDVLNTVKNKYNTSEINVNFPSDYVDSEICYYINTNIIDDLIKKEEIDNLIDFLKYIKSDQYDFRIFVKLGESLRLFLPKIKIYFTQEKIHEIILHSEKINLFSNMDKSFITDKFLVCVVPSLVANSKCLSILYLIRMNYKIFDLDYGRPLLHFIIDVVDGGHSNIYIASKMDNMIKIFIKYNSTCINEKDKDGNTFLHLLAENNGNLIPLLKSLPLNNIKNKYGETFLLVLTKENSVQVMRDIFSLNKKIITEIIDQQNDEGESALIISARENYESIYILLKANGAKDHVKDKYGNTVFHYICLNKMFLGTEIKETENDFGYKPSHYTNLKNYWKFLNVA